MNKLEQIRERLSRITEKDWSWPTMEIDEDGYISVEECDHLGDTLIALDDTYEGSGNDCNFIANSPRDIQYLLDLVDTITELSASFWDCDCSEIPQESLKNISTELLHRIKGAIDSGFIWKGPKKMDSIKDNKDSIDVEEGCGDSVVDALNSIGYESDGFDDDEGCGDFVVDALNAIDTRNKSKIHGIFGDGFPEEDK